MTGTARQTGTAHLCSLAVVLSLGLLAAVMAPISKAHAQGDPPVRINEFSAGQTELADNTGAIEDWIELHNTSGGVVALTGWTIAAGEDIHTFGGELLAAGDYLVVFASGDVSRSIPGEPHLPFKLDADGESLVLSDPAGTISAPTWPVEAPYPALPLDVSLGIDSNGDVMFFENPSPGQANPNDGLGGIVEAVAFSIPGGYYAPGQAVTLSSATPGVTIRYTTDGSVPTASNGTAIAAGGAVSLGQTTTLRAVGVRSGWIPSEVETRSYLMLADVIQQGESTPSGWPDSEAVNEQVMEYGMDSEVVDGNEATIEAALVALPSISIVTDLDNLFDADDGIYVNAENRGREWERAASVELIDPSGAEAGFAIEAGVRIRGGFSRRPENAKHSFRLFFRDEYGGQLDYPLFGSEGVDNYERVDLRTAQNYNWARQAPASATFIDEVWSRDTQAAMGQPYTRSRQYHLYLNGQYWGIYMTQERVSGDYAERYFGGDDSEYDVIKVDAENEKRAEATDGDLAAWQSLYSLVSDGNVSDAEYAQISADVDLVNLADYYLLHFFSGDFDSSPSWFNTPEEAPHWVWSSNWYALRNRTGLGEAGKWQFFDHDSEHSMCVTFRLQDQAETLDNTTPWPLLQSGTDYMTPAWLHQGLVSHPAYRTVFADRVQQHMIDPAGALTVAAGEARLDARVDEITAAIDAQSARWGDGENRLIGDGSGTLYGRADWELAVQRMRNCITLRQSIVETQLRDDNLWPTGQPPLVSPVSGDVSFGASITIDSNGQAGNIIYTLDGTDPIDADGQMRPSALVYSGAIPVRAALTSVAARVMTPDGAGPIAEAMYSLTGPIGPRRVVVNEYNAVADTRFLGDGVAGDVANGSDPTLGRVAGNGGDWFELAIVDDGLDLRGWTVEVYSEATGTLRRSARLTFADSAELADLRAGTLVTVSESIADDISYFPPAGDWNLNLQANDARAGAHITAASQTGFDVDNDDTQIAIFDDTGAPHALLTGEGTAPGAGVNGAEVFKLEGAPNSAITPNDPAYNDGRSSTWGLPNVFAAGLETQDLDRVIFGDANCDGDYGIVDSLFIAQFEVGNRSASECPLADPPTQINAAAGDVNGDGRVNVIDALFVSQCEVGVANVFCPS